MYIRTLQVIRFHLAIQNTPPGNDPPFANIKLSLLFLNSLENHLMVVLGEFLCIESEN